MKCMSFSLNMLLFTTYPFFHSFCYEMLACSILIEFPCYLSSTKLDHISRCACIWFDVVGENVYNKLLKRMPVFSGTLPFRPLAVEANGRPLAELGSARGHFLLKGSSSNPQSCLITGDHLIVWIPSAVLL